MSACKEYGGFLEMEFARGGMYHADAVYLNSARSALKYIIRLHNIKKLAVPFFTCPVIWQAIEEEHCEIVFFDVNKMMEPELENIDKNAYILCNNYFGIQSKLIYSLAKHYKNLIVDNAQAFFAPENGIAAIYSPRKFFGLPDGGMALTSKDLNEEFETDVSYQRCQHLLKRHDLGANAAYKDFCEADSQLDSSAIMNMSNLTKNMMRGINYEFVKKKRRENFSIMHNHLSSLNWLSFDLTQDDVPMAYPLLIERSDIKQKLINHKLYVATYWPHMENVCPKGSNALYLKNNLIPLPIDQRYGCDDIAAMLRIIQDILRGEA